jgi:hypothetical protein
MPRPPQLQGKKRKKKFNTYRFLVEGVNLGDGEPVLCIVEVNREQVTVHKKGSRHRWALSLSDASGVIARRAQAWATSQMLVRTS